MIKTYTRDNLDEQRLYYYLLDCLDIRVDEWGRGQSKPFSSLVNEIQKGECTVDETGIRRMSVVFADVLCEGFRLREDKQVFSDGRIRARKLEFGALGEKLFPDECCMLGLNRMFQEELKIDLFRQVWQFELWGAGCKTTYRPSDTYPGLMSVAKEYRFTIRITKELKEALGGEHIVSVEETKTTYYSWQKVTP